MLVGKMVSEAGHEGGLVWVEAGDLDGERKILPCAVDPHGMMPMEAPFVPMGSGGGGRGGGGRGRRGGGVVGRVGEDIDADLARVFVGDDSDDALLAEVRAVHHIFGEKGERGGEEKGRGLRTRSEP